MKNISNIAYLMRFAWRADKYTVITDAGMLFIIAIRSTMQILLYKLLIDAVTSGQSLVYSLFCVLLYVAAQIAEFSISQLSSRLAARMRMRLEKDMRKLLLDKASVIDMEKFDDPEFYDSLLKAAENSHNCVIDAYQGIKHVVSNAVYAAAGIAVLAALEPVFIVLAALSVTIVLLMNMSMTKKIYQLSENIAPISRRTEYFGELMFKRETAVDIRQYDGLAQLIISHFSSALARKHELQSNMENKNAMNSVISLLFHTILTVLAPYMLLIYKVFNASLSIADMTAVITAFQQANSGISNLTNFIPQIKKAGMLAGHFLSLAKYSPVIEDQAGIDLKDIESIEFMNVTFRYPFAAGDTLTDVSFFVPKGRKLAIVGINGAGKTTIVRLMMRFYDPNSGTVLINGRDIRQYSTRSLRVAVTSVFQEFQSYCMPISELVSCAEGADIDEERVCNALDRVGLLDMVLSGEKGIHSEYGKMFDENGLIFSGGQLQKLIIARMLYKNSSLIIMDEPSSALDPESEYEINRSIMRSLEGKTMILISHRLSTTRDADDIILIEDGSVREHGSHDQLIALGGRYARLYGIQAEGYGAAESG